MKRLLIVVGLVVGTVAPASAQSWVPWHQPDLLEPSRGRPSPAPKPKANPLAGRTAALPPSRLGRPADDDDEDDRPRSAAQAPLPLVDGGPRPDIAPQSPESVSLATAHAPGTILIDTSARRLYLIQSGSSALAYPVSVGREGFSWTGTERISRVASWPDWHPPAEMRERDPRLPIKMTGGVRNPLGAKALYLGSSLYRIHGTSDARSIRRAASSGCFRMHNGHVVDLARRVGVGTRVVVVGSTGTRTAQKGGAGRRATR